ncbi:hypothetical protein ACFWNU_34530, partial [Streptomyces sp. NPDC058427]
MTYDTERTPRIPAESPEAAQQPGRPPMPPGRTAAGRTGTAPGTDRPESTPPATAPAGTTAEGTDLTGTHVSDGRRAGAPANAPTTPRSAPGAHRPLIPEGDQEKLSLRLQHAVTEFVESPVRAVGE